MKKSQEFSKGAVRAAFGAAVLAVAGVAHAQIPVVGGPIDMSAIQGQLAQAQAQTAKDVRVATDAGRSQEESIASAGDSRVQQEQLRQLVEIRAELQQLIGIEVSRNHAQ